MKVRLAVQTVSKSVADALTFLREDMNHPNFVGSKPTSDFLLNFNNLFDIFNSRGKWAKYIYKKRLSKENVGHIFAYFQEMKNYILGLKLQGRLITETRRKTGFVGFLVAIESLKSLYQETVEEASVLKYIATYRLSQDHLELFFGAIRSKGGFNNNPTARQFQAAYKRLLVKLELSGSSSANISDLENITILNCSGITKSEEGENLEATEAFIELESKINEDINKYKYLNSQTWDLTLYAEDIVGYISGFIIRKLKNCVSCPKCLTLLESDISTSHLQKRKTYGKLVKASDLVISICKSGEKFFRFFLKTENIFNKKIDNLIQLLTTHTMTNMSHSILTDNFDDHFYDGDVMNGHASLLSKLILKHYFKLRLHHETNKRLDQSKPRVRSVNTKTILFRNE